MMHRAYEYRGPERYVEGVPFGSTMHPGDHYVGDRMHPDDVALIAPPDPASAVAEPVEWPDDWDTIDPERRPWRFLVDAHTVMVAVDDDAEIYEWSVVACPPSDDFVDLADPGCVILQGSEDEDPTRVLAWIVNAHNRAIEAR